MSGTWLVLVTFGLIVSASNVSSNNHSEVFIRPCQSSRNACDHACQVHRSVSMTCHHATGYCLCPAKAIPPLHCHQPRANLSESKDCSVEKCEVLHKTSEHPKSQGHRHRLPSGLGGRKSHPGLFRGKNKVKAMICSPDDYDRKKILQSRPKDINKEFGFCACFVGGEKKSNGHRNMENSKKMTRMTGKHKTDKTKEHSQSGEDYPQALS